MKIIFFISSLILTLTFLFLLAVKLNNSVSSSATYEMNNFKNKTSILLPILNNKTSQTTLNHMYKNGQLIDDEKKKPQYPINMNERVNSTLKTKQKISVSDYAANNTLKKPNHEQIHSSVVINIKSKNQYQNVWSFLYNQQVDERNKTSKTSGLPIPPHINQKNQLKDDKNKINFDKLDQKNMNNTKLSTNIKDQEKVKGTNLIAKKERDMDIIWEWKYPQNEGCPGCF